jgi:hypothetical protein
MHIFFLALFEKKLINYWISLTFARYPVSGLTRYPAVQYGTRYPAGYRISKKAGLSGRISGASLLLSAKNKPIGTPLNVIVF